MTLKRILSAAGLAALALQLGACCCEYHGPYLPQSRPPLPAPPPPPPGS